MTTSNEEQRTLILTGASRGIGHATVKRFSSAGWRVITCSRHAFPEDCPWQAGPEDHIQVDLADPDDTERAVDEMRARLQGGKLHALVNNAGISPKGENGERLGVMNSRKNVWRQVFEVNLFSTIWLARGLIDELAAAHGAIVNVTSIAGSRVHPFAGAAYSVSKAALAALTREMAADFGPLGVRVNAIAPGYIETQLVVDYWNEQPDPQAAREATYALQPPKRIGQPEEVGMTAVFLASDEATFINASCITIDGGRSALYHD